MSAPIRIVSLWDMLKYEAQLLLGAISYVACVVSEWRLYAQVVNSGFARPLIISSDEKSNFLISIKRLRDSAKELEMPSSIAVGVDAFDFYLGALESSLPMGAFELNQLALPADRLLHSYVTEAGARQFYVIEGKHAKFYADAESLFGGEVVDAFPSVAPDISEAGKCRALGRWTACVMHLMRVLEVGLKRLANRHGVDHTENWNRTLNELETRLRSIQKKVDGVEAERWASEAGTHLRFMKNAYRNHAMHPLERYDEERAVEIYDNTRSFMRHLAIQLAQ